MLHNTFENPRKTYERNLDEVLIRASGWDKFTIKVTFTLRPEWKWQGHNRETLPDRGRTTDWVLSFEQPRTAETKSFKFVPSAANT
jgi:hypothetical protein